MTLRFVVLLPDLEHVVICAVVEDGHEHPLEKDHILQSRIMVVGRPGVTGQGCCQPLLLANHGKFGVEKSLLVGNEGVGESSVAFP